MKRLLPFILALLASGLACAQLTLGPSPYSQDFNTINSGIPIGITVRTGATATALGTVQAYSSAAVAWSNTAGAVKNFASATDLTATATTAQQNGSTNRSLGIRQTGSLGDPGVAFVLQLANTSALKDFKLAFKLQSLDIGSPRLTTWRVDYGFGAIPTSFTTATVTGSLTTGGSAFTNNAVSIDFGSNLNDRPENVWIRIITLTASTGSGNRASSAIDDLSLTYTSGNVAIPSFAVSPSNITFGSQALGTSSVAQSYTLNYANLDGSDVTVSTTAPFAISKSPTGPFSTSLTYTSTELGGTSTTIYSRFTPAISGTASDNILHVGGGVSGSVIVSLTGTGINLAPVATDDSFSGIFGDLIIGNVYSNDTDPQTLALTYTKLTDPQNGLLTFNADGTFSYQSTEGSPATQTFTYRATNTQGLSDEATATITLAEKSKIFISQYYEGTSVNKWIELTNPTGLPVNTASPQLKLGLYSISGDAGNITMIGTPSQIVNLNITIPAKSSVLIGNTGNGTEVPYVTASSAQQTSNSVINFNGNDGVALLDATNNILDAFGTGINAKDVSYVRNYDAGAPSAVFNSANWTRTSLATVQNADPDDPDRLGAHVQPDLPPCMSPTSQPTLLTFNSVGTKTITFGFTASPDASEYLIVRSLNSSLSGAPADGLVYSQGSIIGGGTVAGRIVGTSFTDTNLSSGTTFYYFVYALNSISCDGGPKYLAVDPLSGSQSTVPLPVCATPVSQSTNFNVSFANNNAIQGTFTPATDTDEFLVIMSKDSLLTALPLDEINYFVGDSIGGGIVIKKGGQGTFSRNGLTQDTNYFFYIFSVNSNCSNGPLYLTFMPLTGKHKTKVLNSSSLNFYFGNLHAHSSYSDGNKDDTSKKPEDDYAFAKNSMNMDFLGLSEHNHTQAGMRLAYWQPGMQAAKNATTPDFVALHGMEWGVISGGGHVIVYGMDSLIGWESGEYQIYVPKSTYTGPTGLFNIINRHGLNAIATLAHPHTSDFNGVATNYNALADSAIVGTAVESGPALSKNVTYSDQASSMSYSDYYNQMLAKGYHLGATVDHDNHNMTFGRHTRARLVVLAPALTENDLLDAMKRMRFYASEDSAARITYNINDQPMGSVFTGNGLPRISVSCATTSPVTNIKIVSGIPGSGITPTQLVSSSTGTLFYTDSTLTHLSSGYYYADITEADGSRIITSPIWYTRNDSLKSEQKITFNTLSTKTYGDQDIDPGATSTNATIPVIYSSSDTTIASIINNKVHIIKVGSVNITASQAGNALFKPAASKTQVLVISPKSVMASAEPKSKEYGNADPQLTYIVTPPLVDGDTFIGALTREPGENVGTYLIGKGTLALSSNYTLVFKPDTLTITPAEQAIIFASLPGKTYGDTDFTLNATGGASGNPVIYTSSDSSVATIVNGNVHIVGAGITTISASQAGNQNYSASMVVTQNLIVNKATATITIANLSQTFDGTPKSVTVTTNPPGLNNIEIMYNGSATAPSAVGTYSVVASLINNNYTAAPTSATLIITPSKDLKIQYRNADASLTNNEGKPYLKIVNTGTTAVPYSQLTARYWITPENFTGTIGMWIDYAQLGNNKVIMKYVSLSDPRVNALGYIEYSFSTSAGSLAAGSNSGEIQSRYANSDWSVFNEVNDYSIGTNTSYTDKSSVTLYRNGLLIWGTEPPAETSLMKLKVYAEAKSSGSSNTISTDIDIRNEGNIPLDCKDITARYWFTSEGISPLKFQMDYAKIGNNAISGSFVTLSPMRVNADTYLELKVLPPATTFYPLTSTGNIQYRISKSDWSNFNQLNDHSYQTGVMAENSKITLYYKGQLVFGTEPNAGSIGARTTTADTSFGKELKALRGEESSALLIYPNPSTGCFTLQMNDLRSGTFKITIYDSVGKAIDVYSGKKKGCFSKDYELQLTHGIYYILVSWKDHTDYKTIVIN